MSKQFGFQPALFFSQRIGWKIPASGLALIGLYLISRYSFVLFHTLVELFSIAISWSLFLIAWNVRQWTNNRYFFILGLALSASGCLDLVHTFAYEGLNLFSGYDSNLPMQLWIAARYLQSLSILFVPFVLTTGSPQTASSSSRKQENFYFSFETGAMALYAIIVTILPLLIFMRQFPVCYIEGQGLTPFKKVSEIIICLILLVAIVIFWTKRQHFEQPVARLLMAAIITCFLSEMAFLFVANFHGFFNLIGLFCKLCAFFLFYLAGIKCNLHQLYGTINRNLTEKTAALQKSEAQFRLLVENANDIIYSLRPDGVFSYVSPTWTNFQGHAVSEVENHNFKEFVHPDDYAACLEFLQRTIQTGKKQTGVEYRVLHKDGSWHWHTSNASPIFDASGKVISFSGIARDITERKHAEILLKRNSARQAAMLANISDVIAIIDEDGIIRYKSPNIEKWFGWLPEDFVGQSFWKTIHPDDLEFIQQEFTALLKVENSATSLEYRFKQKDGNYSIIRLTAVNLTGNPDINGILMNYHDITERKQAEEALEKERILTDAILASVPGLVYLYDEQGYLLRWNKKHEEITGYSSEELDHFYLLDWYKDQPEDIERITKGVQKALTEGFASAEGNIITKNGSAILFNLTAVRLELDGKVYFTGIGIDISERRKTEEKIKAAQAELQQLLAETERSRQALLSVVEDQKEAEEHIRQLNRELEKRVHDRTAQLTAANQELEAFAYSVSHDLRSPLRALDGFSSTLMSDYADKLDEQGLHYLFRIQEASRRMAQLINDLLNLSRVTRSEFARQPLNLSLLAETIAAELKAQVPQRQIELKITPNMEVDGDANLIKIVMENLLSNAFKFTSKLEQASIQIGMIEEADKRIYFIRDNGAGFKMEYASKLFTPFQRLHGVKEFPGTGIGLSIVQRIITRHGGRIWPESEVGQGTTFYFTLGESR